MKFYHAFLWTSLLISGVGAPLYFGVNAIVTGLPHISVALPCLACAIYCARFAFQERPWKKKKDL